MQSDRISQLRPVVDGVLMPDGMLNEPLAVQQDYAAMVKAGNAAFIAAVFAVEDAAAALNIDLDS